MGKKLLSFGLRTLMVTLMMLASLQLAAMLVGTSPVLQGLLVVGASVTLTYNMAMVDGRLCRARTRRKIRLQVAAVVKPVRVA